MGQILSNSALQIHITVVLDSQSFIFHESSQLFFGFARDEPYMQHAKGD
jgi:hypothetical protein